MRGHGSAAPDPERRPNLPVTPEQVVTEALAAWRAGATVLHLHAREDDGTPTQDRAAFRRLVDPIRDAGCDAILNLSTGTAGGRSERDDRLRPLDLEPEMASFDCRTINFGDRIFEGDLPFLRRMAAAFQRSGARPEVECCDTGHVGLALQLQQEGLLPAEGARARRPGGPPARRAGRWWLARRGAGAGRPPGGRRGHRARAPRRGLGPQAGVG